MRKTTRKTWAVAAGVTGIALLATACGSDPGTDPSADPSSEGPAEPITLTVATFNEFGYTDEMFAEYEEANPHVTIEHKKAATSNEARDNLNTKLAGGSGLSDIEAVEVDWLPELMAVSDNFVDLTDPELEGRWLDWKVAQATTTDGKLIGYGTDIGPEGIAYRADLFAAAGLPSDREEVKELFGGDAATWDKYFEVGNDFVANSDVPFFDSAQGIYQGMVNQLEAAYEDPATGDIIVADNAEVRALYDQVLTAAVDDDQSAHFSQWSEDWTGSFQKDGFATMLAPGWMLGVIEGNAAGVEGWDIADVFPGGGGNWGGSFLTVPTQGAHPDEAKKLAAWLTAPEQQIKAFLDKGTFPSQVEALASDDLLGVTNAFFNDAPTGQILSNRAAAVTVAPFKGPNYFAVQDAMSQAIGRVDVDKTANAEDSWNQFLDAVASLG